MSAATIDLVLYFALRDHPLGGEGAIYASNLLLMAGNPDWTSFVIVVIFITCQKKKKLCLKKSRHVYAYALLCTSDSALIYFFYSLLNTVNLPLTLLPLFLRLFTEVNFCALSHYTDKIAT